MEVGGVRGAFFSRLDLMGLAVRLRTSSWSLKPFRRRVGSSAAVTVSSSASASLPSSLPSASPPLVGEPQPDLACDSSFLGLASSCGGGVMKCGVMAVVTWRMAAWRYGVDSCV